MTGELKKPGTLLFREAAGDAKDQNGNEYELSTAVTSGTPIVRCLETGVWWIISWTQLLNLAKEAGIDKKWPKEKKK
jgi:hypothetical protein